MKKTIAIDIRLFGKKRTGDETVFFHLTKEILAIDKENEYRLMTDVSDPSKLALLQGRLECVGQKNVQFISLRGNKFIWNLVTLPWFLFRNYVDVYHTQYILPFFIPKRTKVATHIHDVSFAAFPELIGLVDRFFLSLLIPRSLRRAKLIITPSQFTKDEISKYYGTAAEKIVVIPNALGEEFLENSEENISRVREKYKLPAEFILYVGTLQPRKNIPFLIRAFALLKKRLPMTKLVLVGSRTAHHVDRGIEEALKELVTPEDVLFPGYIEQNDLPALIRAARLFVFPTKYEGFGIPILEAMSQDVPIAASNTPCLREIGGNGVLYFDEASLASCEEIMYNLFTDENLRGDTVQRAKERLLLFSWRKSAELLQEKYQSLT